MEVEQPRGIASLAGWAGIGSPLMHWPSQAAAAPPRAATPPLSPHPPQQQAPLHAAACGSACAPHYQAPTHVQPKAPLQACPHASAEAISAAFAPVTCAGIRSLPDALAPGFREVFYLRLVRAGREAAEKLRAAQRASGGGCQSCDAAAEPAAAPPAAAAEEGPGPAAPPLGLHGSGLSARRRQRLPAPPGELPSRFGPARGFFCTFPHAPCDYGSARAAEAAARAAHKASQARVCGEEFVVRGAPPALVGAPGFAPFTLEPRPFVAVDHLGRPAGRDSTDAAGPPAAAAAAALDGPFVPAGRAASPGAALKSRAGELLAAVSRDAGRMFPGSFLQAFLDARGAVVVAFARGAAAAEGDVAAFMGEWSKFGDAALQFRLCKDATRWGVVEEPGDAVFYSLWPPWARHRAVLPDALARPPPPPPRRRGDGDGDGEEGCGGGGGGRAVLRRAETEGRGPPPLGIRGLLV
ncbi:hypothetical protein Rsub_03441 [Raphidocelis subcapitata]|uniref:Uncharacterized protein n=1 Tax=Raphidocelis subcapitata TaxID=307507 RepID=A0A2V0P039_9CHLO|nr:hypothetical protein Rsub_03441 [Raphidocelis subcapitata]|eukprot:GBF90445.1 hypothetical protein Rsub_03441 [Raphidocelis subcapitata]